MQDDNQGNMLEQIERDIESPGCLDEMIEQGNKIYKDYKDEIIAAKRAEAHKQRLNDEQEDE